MYICTCMLRDTTEIQNSRYATAIFQLVMKSSKSGEFEMLRTPPPPGGGGERQPLVDFDTKRLQYTHRNIQVTPDIDTMQFVSGA